MMKFVIDVLFSIFLLVSTVECQGGGGGGGGGGAVFGLGNWRVYLFAVSDEFR